MIQKLVFGCVSFTSEFFSRSRLASRQWSLFPNKNSEKLPFQIPNF